MKVHHALPPSPVPRAPRAGDAAEAVGPDVPGPVLDWARRNLDADGDPGGWTPLDGGRTNRLWRVRGREGDLVVKLYVPRAATRLFPNSPVAESRALRLLAGSGLAPALRGLGATAAGHVLCYAAVAGTSPLGAGGTAAVARALADLHARPVQGGFRRVSLRPRALARGILADLEHHTDGAQAFPVRSLAARALTRAPATGPVVLLHGDPVATNALRVRQGAVTLIDWQCPALGDPLHDLAIALSPGMRALYGQAPLTPVERAAFWQAYRQDGMRERHAALAPLLSARIAAHFLAQAARGRPGYAAAAEAELAALEE